MRKTGKHKYFDRYSVGIILLLFCFLIAIVALFVFLRLRTKESKEGEMLYDRHYVYIAQSDDSYISRRIYEAAGAYGKQHGAYVEKISDVTQINYSDVDFVRMASSMQVDGIILEGTEDSGLRAAVKEAEEAGIPVITVLSDCAGSKRSAYIESGMYNMGRDYGRSVIDVTNTREPKILVLTDSNINPDFSTFLEGFGDTLAHEGNHLNVDIRTEDVTDLPNFRLMDRIQEILTDEETKPDILVCMNEHNTKVVYQAMKDYSLTGESMIVGCGLSESMLHAVQDGEVAALVDVDSEQVGMLCIDTLTTLNRSGTVSPHIYAEDTIVTEENVARYLDE